MWDCEEDDDDEFVGMHGDEMGVHGEDDYDDAIEEAAEEAAFVPFVPADCDTPGLGYNVLSCPSNVPGDLETGTFVARWFGAPYNKWYVGKILEVNKRRTVQENVTAITFTDEVDGETLGHFVASKDNYGADRDWVLLKQITIELDAGEMEVEEID